jgi:ABC-type branched-chain amino acid transport systems, periplasmic component
MTSETNKRIEGNAEPNGSSTSNLLRRRFLQASGAGAVTALAGCTGGSDGGTISLGATYILSGFASIYGEEAEQGFSLAEEEINEAGGIDGQQLEIIPRDTEADGATAIRQMRSLIEEEGVVGLFGLDSSGVAQAVAPQVGELQTPFMITHAATPYVTTPTGEHPDAVGNEYLFRCGNSLVQDMHGAARVASTLDVSSWATIGPDYAFGYETWDYFQAFCDGLDVDASFIGEQYPPLASSDYTPFINAVLDLEPEGVITPLWGADLTTFLGQARESGWFDQIGTTLFSVGMGTDIPTEGAPLPEGVYASTRYDPFIPDTPTNTAFRDTYYGAYDGLPTYNAEGAYRAVYLYKEAIEAVGTDADAVADYFAGLQTEGPVGEYSFSPTNQATVPGVWGQVSYSDEWGSNILDPVEQYPGTPDAIVPLLEGSGLPAGV